MLTWGTVDKTKLKTSFMTDVEQLLSASPYLWKVTWGTRTMTEQKRLHDIFLMGGPKAAPPGESPHNFGLAVDVVLDGDPNKPGVQPTWDIKLAGWLWLFAKVKAHPRLKSGVGFGDGGHIERFKWRNHI